jgi:hypothetical protein
MKKVSLLLVIELLCISLSSLAGEVITNDTGGDATGLRVTFSEPVQITAFGDTLMAVDQTGPADEFVFSGGTVSPWGSHWMNWTPSAAQIVSHEWLTGSTTTLQGLPAGQLGDRPVVTGDLLNPDYLAHPAYVMQGVSERNAVFALPLDGIEELAFYPLVEGVDQEQVDWSVDVSHPEGIGASIESRTLYIWGSNASWAGYGQVTLEAVLGDAVSSVAIPVAVFREDKTLINAEGKKDYFVPWSPELDINRIGSTQNHVSAIGEPDPLLDQGVRFSRFIPMLFLRDITFTRQWYDSSYDSSWSDEIQRLHVTCLLESLGEYCIDTIRVRLGCFMDSPTSSEISLIYARSADTLWPHELSIPPDFLEHITLEAHRLGMRVLIVPFLADTGFSRGDIAPVSWNQWFQDYRDIAVGLATLCTQLGVDFLGLGDGLVNVSGTIDA